jgi:NAD(P)-dependent dehydrogenase (short-subunit alcohol dehydrogenase family)
MNMQGKVVAITGASRGIGAAAARAFAATGARVVLMARSVSDLDALAAETGGLALPCDVADWASVEGAVARTVTTLGRLDVMVNNAGQIEPIAALAEADPSDWARAVQVNLTGTFHGLRAAIPVMRAQRAGTIINISSGAATQPLEGWSAYCASKAGALMLTRAAHLEESGNGLRILGLSPGTVATEMQRVIAASGVNPVSRLAWEDHIPPEWPAKALLWMCTPEADDFLGQDVKLREEGIRRRAGLIP